MAESRDYFSFDTIRDKEGNVVCYYVTVIGTIEAEGIARMRTDLKEDGSGKMAFGQVTIHDRDRKIGSLLAETGCRIRSHMKDEVGSVDVISYTASDWRADEAFEFNEGDRVLIEGKAYIRKDKKMPERKPEISITATGLFLLGRKRMKKRVNLNPGLIPQKD